MFHSDESKNLEVKDLALVFDIWFAVRVKKNFAIQFRDESLKQKEFALYLAFLDMASTNPS